MPAKPIFRDDLAEIRFFLPYLARVIHLDYGLVAVFVNGNPSSGNLGVECRNSLGFAIVYIANSILFSPATGVARAKERERVRTGFLTDMSENKGRRDFRVNTLVKVIATYCRRNGVSFYSHRASTRDDDRLGPRSASIQNSGGKKNNFAPRSQLILSCVHPLSDAPSDGF